MNFITRSKHGLILCTATYKVSQSSRRKLFGMISCFLATSQSLLRKTDEFGGFARGSDSDERVPFRIDSDDVYFTKLMVDEYYNKRAFS